MSNEEWAARAVRAMLERLVKQARAALRKQR
jgi:hypothetical protein